MMLCRAWCYRGSLARWCIAAIITYGTLGMLMWENEETPLSQTTSATKPAVLDCRADIRVNLLPPMSNQLETMLKDLFTYITQPHPLACRKALKLGGMAIRNLATGEAAFADGHKYACADPEFSLLTTDRCLVYSFGISDDWSFDWEAEALGCEVFAFDPSVNVTSGSQNGSIVFLQYGVGEFDHETEQGWHIRTLDTFNSRLRHTNRTVHYLKVDVEGSEWSMLRQQLSRGADSMLATRVEQLAIELHFSHHLPRREHMLFFMEVYQAFLDLQQMGFYLFSYERNFAEKPDVVVPGLEYNVTSSMEVVWIRSRCADAALEGG